MTASAVLIGSTGLVGKNILTTLTTQPAMGTITTISRRTPSLPAAPSANLTTLTSPDTTTWPQTLTTLTPPPTLFITALGTTKARAGSLAAQHAIDHDLNLALATAAHAAGARVCVLISTSGASPASLIPYSKMKGRLEAGVTSLGFETTVLVRPGLIVGERDESRPAEAVFRAVASAMGRWAGAGGGGWLKDVWAQDAEVIARAAVRAGTMALEGRAPGKVWVLEQRDVVRLGRTEWKD